MKNYIITMAVAIFLAGCSGADMARLHGAHEAQQAESFCAGIGIDRANARFQDCIFEYKRSATTCTTAGNVVTCR